MGLISDFFLATSSGGRKYACDVANDADLDKKYRRISSKGLTGVEVSALWALLQQRQLSREHLFAVVSTERDPGITEQLAPALVELLAELPDEKVASTSAAWSKVKGVGLAEPELAELLGQLKKLASKAVTSKRGIFASKQGVFMWYSP